jgi:tetratricopeptide (TPR) repeat protein
VAAHPGDQPDPIADPGARAFTELLAELRRWAGQPSLRRLCQLGGTVRAPSGHLVPALPPSTVSSVLRRKQLPRLDFVEAFVAACLRARRSPPDEIDDAIDRWQRAWRDFSTTPDADGERPPVVGTQQHHLPADIPEFTGRAGHIRFLMGLGADDGHRGTPDVAVIEGMGGVGKTRLAVHVAHALTRAGRFDNFLYLELHGFARDRRPTEPAAALEALLRLLGVPGENIPEDVSARAAMYRDRLHGTRTLVLLDDAYRESQVMDLLPAYPACLVFVTTRRALAVDGAQCVRLEPFTAAESTDLLSRLAGPVRIAADPAGAAAAASRCGNLPLAVALAGRRLQARPAWSIDDLQARLRDSGRRLDQLDAGSRSVRASFQLSYDALTAVQQRTFRLLALHPGDSFGVAGVAMLTDVPAHQATVVLESLVDDYLLQQPAPGRYSFHDLLREYAGERLDAGTTAAERAAALTRLLRWYLQVIMIADRLVDPHHRHVTAEPADMVDVTAPFETRDAAMAWIETEYGALTRAVSLAAAGGADSIAWRLTAALWSYLYLSKRWGDWVSTHRTALAAAERAGSLEGRAWTLNNLGLAHWQRRDFSAAVDCYREALELRQALGDLDGEVVLLDNLGNAYDELGFHDEAVACLQRALTLAEQFGSPSDRANVLNNLGEAHRRAGRFADAQRCLVEALSIQQDLDDVMQRFTLCSLGELYDDMGETRDAEAFYHRGRHKAEETGDTWLTALLWEKLGHTASVTGDLPEAKDRWATAAVTYAQIDDQEASERVRALLRGAQQ